MVTVGFTENGFIVHLLSHRPQLSDSMGTIPIPVLDLHHPARGHDYIVPLAGRRDPADRRARAWTARSAGRSEDGAAGTEGHAEL